MVTVRILEPAEHELLAHVEHDVFDGPVLPDMARQFLGDPRHHLAVAINPTGRIVGMASGVHYVHPDKLPQLFINEVGVSAAYEGQGIGKRLLDALLHRARELGCSEAWTATEPDNAAAQALYRKGGGVPDPTPFVMFTFAIDAPTSTGGTN